MWALVGRSLEVEALSGDRYGPPQLLAAAASEIARELGRGPGSQVAVAQRVRSWHDDGKVSLDQANAAVDYLVDGDADESEVEVVANEFGRVVRQRMHHDAMLQMHEVYAGRRHAEDVVRTLETAAGVGRVDGDLGVRLGTGSFEEIASLRSMECLPTGVVELDAHTGGGLPIGQEGMYIARPGGGKSIALTSQASFGLRRRLVVGIVTLELPVGVQLARVKANLTGIPVNSILQGETRRCEELLEEMRPLLGTLYVKKMTPLATTNAEIEDWVSSVEDAEGSRMNLLVVDYADKVGAPAASDKSQSDYNAMRYVYERFRIHAEERKAWIWTASQSTRAHRGQNILDLDHVADSMHKGRIVDQAISINPRDEGKTNLFFVAKNRTGASQIKVGPIRHEYHLGRIAHVDVDLDVLAVRDPGSPELEQAWEAAQVEQVLRGMGSDGGEPW